MLIIHFVCESKWQNHDFFHHCETFSQTCESKFLSFLVRLIFGSVFVLLSSLKLTLFQSKFPLQKCSPFQSVSHLKNIFFSGKKKLRDLDYPGNLHFCMSKLWEKDQITRSAKTFVFCSFSHIKKKLKKKCFFLKKILLKYYIIFCLISHFFIIFFKKNLLFTFNVFSPVSQVRNTVEKNIFFLILDHQKPKIFYNLVF